MSFKSYVPLTTFRRAHEGDRHITGLTHNARAKFQAVREQLDVAGVDRAYWDIAVEVRIGEIRNLLGEKLSAMSVRLPPAAPNTMSFGTGAQTENSLTCSLIDRSGLETGPTSCSRTKGPGVV